MLEMKCKVFVILKNSKMINNLRFFFGYDEKIIIDVKRNQYFISIFRQTFEKIGG